MFQALVYIWLLCQLALYLFTCFPWIFFKKCMWPSKGNKVRVHSRWSDYVVNKRGDIKSVQEHDSFALFLLWIMMNLHYYINLHGRCWWKLLVSFYSRYSYRRLNTICWNALKDLLHKAQACACVSSRISIIAKKNHGDIYGGFWSYVTILKLAAVLR